MAATFAPGDVGQSFWSTGSPQAPRRERRSFPRASIGVAAPPLRARRDPRPPSAQALIIE